MNVGQLYERFRSDVADEALPYLWTDDEVYAYMNDAYRTFARLTGGIADVSSDVTLISVTAGEMYSSVSPLILRFRFAELNSVHRPLTIMNWEDLQRRIIDDYGRPSLSMVTNRQGIVHTMVIGMEQNGVEGKVRWVNVPVEDDEVSIGIYRLPLLQIDASTDPDTTFDEVRSEHHESFLMWMKARAYGKQDAETINVGKQREFEQGFINYCAVAKAEAERYKHKTRVVAYGGL